MPDTPPPITVWSEDVDPSGPPPRTDPPRHVQQRASEVYERVAGIERPRRKPAWWGYGIGMGLLLAGGVVAWFRLDAGLMHTPTLALVVGGLAVVVKAVLGYR